MSDELTLIDLKEEAKEFLIKAFAKLESDESKAKFRAAINAYSGHIAKVKKEKVKIVKEVENVVFKELKHQYDESGMYSIGDCEDMIESMDDGEEKEAWIKLRDYIKGKIEEKNLKEEIAG